MHDLEKQIADWRRQMTAGGIKTSAVLDELESHLREDLAQHIRTGLPPDKAFETAVQRIGRSEWLKAEFAKLNDFKEARAGKVIGIACCGLAVPFSILWTPHLLTIPEMGTGQRLLGLLAVALIWFAVASCWFSYRHLPVIRSRRARMFVELACGLGGIAWVYVFMGFLLNVVLAGASTAQIPVFWIAIAFLWAMALLALLGATAFGLEEAAYRKAQRRKA
jgi:hypothetical protein